MTSGRGAEGEVDRAELAALPDDAGRPDAAGTARLTGTALGDFGGGLEQVVAHREQALGEPDAGWDRLRRPPGASPGAP